MMQGQDYYRQQIHTIEVPLPQERVWELWTTADGIAKFFAPAADIGDAPGDPYVIKMDTSASEGRQGNEGCVITRYNRPEQLAFQWIAPPKFAEERKTKMEVFLQLESPQPSWTKITLAHIGWQEGGQWEEVYAYFERAWPYVLNNFKQVAYKERFAPLLFLEGTWQNVDDPRQYEAWHFDAVQMTGKSYAVSGGDTTIQEQMTLSAQGASFYFEPVIQAAPAEEETPFEITTTEADAFTATRAGDDFPRKIRYSRKGQKLTVTLSGTRNGQETTMVLRFKKVN